MRTPGFAMVLLAACGGDGPAAVDFRALQRFFPPEMAGLPRGMEHGMTVQEAEGSIPMAACAYFDEETGASIHMTIMDWIAAPGAVESLRGGRAWMSSVTAAFANMPGESRTMHGRPAIVFASEDVPLVTIQLLAGDRFVVTVTSDAYTAHELEALLGQMDLAGLGAFRP